MSKFNVNVVHKPSMGPGQCLSALAMSCTIRGCGIDWGRMKMDDHYYYAPGWNDWRKIFNYLLPRVPKYYVDRFDCENIADWIKVHVAEEFGFNTCARVDGRADMGRGVKEPHAWSFFYDATSRLFFQLEGQTGVIMNAGDPLYTPSEIIIG